MNRSSLRPVVAGVAAVVMSLGALSACGSGGGTSDKAADDAVKSVTGKGGKGKSTATRKGNSELDTAAYALVTVMSSTFSDYEIKGDTVRLIVTDGKALSGSECTIVTSAVSGDHPDATFVIDDHGEKTTC